MFQTLQTDETSRDESNKKDLSSEIRSIWLGQRFWNQTFVEDLASEKDQNPAQEVQEIRQLLDEDDRRSEEKQL